jgi:hypothetical protein
MSQISNSVSHKLAPLAEQLGWKQTSIEASYNAECCEYESENLIIRIVVDKGVSEISIGSRQNPEQLRDVSFFKDYLNPLKKGHWNLSVQQQCEFIEQHWSWLNDNLSKGKSLNTIRKIDETANTN